MARIASRLPPDLSVTEKTSTLSKAASAVAALPAEASPEQREQAGRKAIDREAAEQRLIEEGLREAPRHARRVLQDYRYSAKETARDIELRVTGEVQKRLSEELDGTEGLNEVRDLADDLIEQLEGCQG